MCCGPIFKLHRHNENLEADEVWLKYTYLTVIDIYEFLNNSCYEFVIQIICRLFLQVISIQGSIKLSG